MTSVRPNTRATGTEYEEKASEYLISSGYRILEKNYRSRTGEIDIIARDREWLVFVEVKFRATGKSGDPLEAIDLKKQRKISRTASFYLLSHHLSFETPCRFDVVAITPDEIRLIRNAFDYLP